MLAVRKYKNKKPQYIYGFLCNFIVFYNKIFISFFLHISTVIRKKSFAYK